MIKEFSQKREELGDIIICFPLYIITEQSNYLFDFLSDTNAGRRYFHDRMEKVLYMQGLFPEDSVLVLVAENYEHMKWVISQTASYVRRGLGENVLYTHDSKWFYNAPGQVYSAIDEACHSKACCEKLA